MSVDIFVAQSKPEEALVGPLHTITYVTSNSSDVDRMFIKGMSLKASEWFIPTVEEKDQIDAYFGLDEINSWKMRSFYQTGIGKNIQIRVIVIDKLTSQIRPNVSGTYLGGLSIGFPMKEIDAREQQMENLGFPSVVGNKRLEFSSPSGETYVSEEIHFPGPENIYILGVNRPDIFVPVGPLDPQVNIGAPAYSAQCVIDCDATKTFYEEVLGYEIRRDMTMAVGDRSGLKLKEGSDERFIQAFAPGANTGYLVFLDHMDQTAQLDPAPSLSPPSRGLCMWSFPTNDLEEVHNRAIKHNVKILQQPANSKSPFLPNTKTLILSDPGGYPIEIFQN